MNTTDFPIKSERKLKTPSRRHLERVVSWLAEIVDSMSKPWRALITVGLLLNGLLGILQLLTWIVRLIAS